MAEPGMIDRVARAMAAKDSGPQGSALFDIHWKEFGAGYVESARAAIEAMREPTDAFLAALASRMHDAQFSRSGEDYPVARNFLRALVDAALAEKE